MSTTATRLLTAEDLLQMPGHGKGFELVKGKLRGITADELLLMSGNGKRQELLAGKVREMAPGGFEHGNVGLNITTPVDTYVRKHDLGKCVAAETGFLLSQNPDTVRAADLAYVSKRRLRKLKLIRGYFPGAPDLAVEVVSPWDRWVDLEAKIAAWVEAGTKLVWVLHPHQKTVTIYRKDREPVVLTTKDTLTGGNVLPGFSLPVKALFT